MGKGAVFESEVEKPIALFSHKIDRSGAPVALLDMARVLADNGHTVFIFSPQEGELATSITDEGIHLVVYQDFYNDHAFLDEIVSLFGDIVLNTLFWKPLICYFAQKKKKVFWWVHEGESSFEDLDISPEDKKEISLMRLWAASPQIQRFIKKYFDIDAEVLNCYVDDHKTGNALPDSPTIRFLHVSSYIEANKGQLLLAKAITLLPEAVRKKCAFIICGNIEKADQEILAGLRSVENLFDNVRIIDSVLRQELFELYDMVDVIVVPSYHETTSLIAVEGLMKEKLCICSDGCGICDYLTDQEDAFVFKAGNASALAEKLEEVVKMPDKVRQIRKKGREIYEKIYTKEIFEQKLVTLLR